MDAGHWCSHLAGVSALVRDACSSEITDNTGGQPDNQSEASISINDQSESSIDSINQ